MARVYGGWANSEQHWRSYMDYTTVQDDSRVYVRFSGGWQTVSWYYQLTQALKTEIGWTENGTDYPEDSYEPSEVYETYSKTWEHEWWNITGNSFYFTRARSARTVGVWLYCHYHGSHANAYGSSTAYVSLTIPAKPSYAITYNANGGTGTITSQTKWYNEDLTLASSGFSRSYYIQDGWAVSAGGPKVYELGETYTGNSALTLYAHWVLDAPADIQSASASRTDDSSATVSWVPGTGYATTYARVYVERSTDGGLYEVVGYTAGTASSYTDATTTANHAYTYRVRAWNGGDGDQYSGYASTSTIYNTPAAPASVSGARTGSDTDVLLTVDNDGTLTATGFEVERSTDQSTWTAVTPSSSSGSPVSSITLASQGGAYYYRVRNTRSTLKSAWTQSGLVVTITPPAAPTLVSPTSGQTIGATGSTKSVTMEFQHNPLDGSAQTAAQVRYRKSTSSSWTTQTLTTQTSYTATLDEGYTYVWQARTKGADDDYGEWSGTQVFNVYKVPTVSITSPSGTVIGMPIEYTVSYLDTRGTFVSGTLTISLGGTVLYSEPLPATATTMGTASNISGTITTDEFLPSSGNTYTLAVSVRSSDTLTATASISMPVSMGEPYHGTLDIANDPDTGYVSLTVGWDSATGAVSADYATLYRVTEWGRVLLGDNLADGAGIVDMYAPLNTDYYYEVVTHASSTAIFTVQFPNNLATTRWFAYWNGSIAWAKWNPKGSYSLTRPEKKRVHYAGRKWPLSYDSRAMDEQHSMSWTVVDLGDWSNGFRQLMDDGGRGVYKSCDGHVFHADFDFTSTPDYTSLTKMGEVSLTITRIDGDVL